jgi:hypothetical protein
MSRRALPGVTVDHCVRIDGYRVPARVVDADQPGVPKKATASATDQFVLGSLAGCPQGIGHRDACG